MSNINIGRYSYVEAPSESPWSGWIEGETDSGQRWIIYLDDHSRPAVYWAHRESDGTVIGEPIKL